MNSSTDTTISGTSKNFSYAGWTASAIQSLESSNGSALPLTIGTGNSSTLNVSVTAVSEPSSFALIAVGLGAAAFRRRLQNAARHCRTFWKKA
ncbi:MAG: PEP-CTERM sorting domain-containing protein [Pirellula sp.]|nr:PEP-CTERM sorting domain-containing protein [Pirellula sp.]